MSSAKTPYLKLNQWNLDDDLKMDEFNRDNKKIDVALEEASQKADVAYEKASRKVEKYLSSKESDVFTGNNVSLHADVDMIIESISIRGKTMHAGSGQASPKNIKKITNDVPDLFISGNNLLPCRWSNLSHKEELEVATGSYYTINQDGSYHIVGDVDNTAGGYKDYYLVEGEQEGSQKVFPLPLNGYYSLSGLPADISSRITFVLEYMEGGVRKSLTQNNIQTKLFQNAVLQRAYLRIYSGHYEFDFAPMLNMGKTSLPYEPYRGYKYTLAGRALYGNTDVYDEWHSDGTMIRRWNKYACDGTEEWGQRQGTDYFVINYFRNSRGYEAGLVCSHFQKVSSDEIGIKEGVARLSTDTIAIHYGSNVALSEFKAWLAAQYSAGTPVEIVFESDKPSVQMSDSFKPPVLDVFQGDVHIVSNYEITVTTKNLIKPAEVLHSSVYIDAEIAKTNRIDRNMKQYLGGSDADVIIGNNISLNIKDDAWVDSIVVKGSTTQAGSGQVSPTNIRKITGVKNPDVFASGVNLLPCQWSNLPNGNKALSESYYTVNEDGSYHIDVTVDNAIIYRDYYLVGDEREDSKKDFPLPLNGYYSMSGLPFGPNIPISFVLEYVENGVERIITQATLHTKNFHNAVLQRVFLRIYYGHYEFDFAPMLNIGQSPLPYEPYVQKQLSFPAGIELFDRKDSTGVTVISDSISSEGQYTKCFEKIVFDGSETWVINPQLIMFSTTIDHGMKPGGLFLCSHFERSVNNNSEFIDYFNDGDHHHCLIITSDKASSVEDLKAWLTAQYAAGTPVEIIYELNEPVVTKIGITESPPSDTLQGSTCIVSDREIIVAVKKLARPADILYSIALPTVHDGRNGDVWLRNEEGALRIYYKNDGVWVG